VDELNVRALKTLLMQSQPYWLPIRKVLRAFLVSNDETATLRSKPDICVDKGLRK
jgi:hypothetical protein